MKIIRDDPAVQLGMREWLAQKRLEEQEQREREQQGRAEEQRAQEQGMQSLVQGLEGLDKEMAQQVKRTLEQQLAQEPEQVRQLEREQQVEAEALRLQLKDAQRQMLKDAQRQMLKEVRRALLSGFFNGFSDGWLCLVPRKHRERVYEQSKDDAELNRDDYLKKGGNEAEANREYHREKCKAVLGTFLTLPGFFIGEIWSQLRRMVAPR